MRRISYTGLARFAMFTLVIAGFAASAAMATPSPNSAVFNLRIFNDDPNSVLTTVDNYPAQLIIDDSQLDGDGINPEFANLHNWRFSEDDVNEAVFNNADAFKFSAFLIISGSGHGEAGLQISPWFSQDVDGRLNVRTTDGEIAVFGGRLPFYSFTGSHGINYVKGDVIHLEMTYLPNGLSAANPGTLQVDIVYNSTLYSSGPLPFDEGNAAEGFGTWGILNDARVGGHHQPFIQVGNPQNNLRATWFDIKFTGLVTPTVPTTWGRLKAIYK
ncbi:MAG: hypothetical protein ACRD1T_21830 [Acidimicrobiia bacterium]